MLGKAAVIFVLLGTVYSDPIKRSVIITPNDLIPPVIKDFSDHFHISVAPETLRSVDNLLNNAVGLKLSALEIGGKLVQWLITNLSGIALGGLIAFGICKITGICDFDSNPISKLYSLISSDRLDSTESLLARALKHHGKKYKKYDSDEYFEDDIEEDAEEDPEEDREEDTEEDTGKKTSKRQAKQEDEDDKGNKK